MTSTPRTTPNSPTAGTALSSAADDPAAEWRGVSLRYGPAAAVDGVTLAVPPGALVALLGPSGCGKTSLLHLLAGVTTPTAGRVSVAGTDVTDLPPDRRGCGVVFQHYALFPHMTALDNAAFGLAVRGVCRRERRECAGAVLAGVGLTPAEFGRRPAALSGGQQQRVALARALAFGPRVLLLDEPFANLDRALHDQLRAELVTVHRAAGVSTVLVTHDPADALSAADLVGVLDRGRLVESGPPLGLYRRPRTPYAALLLGGGTVWPAAHFGLGPGLALVRPEAWRLGGGDHHWPGTVTAARFAGSDWAVDVRTSAGSLTLRTADPPAVGATVRVGVDAAAVWPFPPAAAS